MSRLTVVNFISLDGVIQAPLSADEDRSGGFSGGGWVADRPGDIVAAYMKRITLAARGMLLGRHTYETFVRVWSGAGEEDPAVAAMNRMTKFVASTTLTSGPWQNTVILSDVPGAVELLRREAGPDIVVFGSSVLLRTLIRHDLVDRYHLLLYPVILGEGKKMFAAEHPARPLRLSSSEVSPSGVTMVSYERRRT